MTPVVAILIVAALLLSEAFFSGSEIALVAANRTLLREKAQAGSRGAALALKLLAKPERILYTTLVGTNTSTVLNSVVITMLLVERFGSRTPLVTLLIFTPLTLTFGEMVPKTIFQQNAVSAAQKISTPLSVFMVLFSPIVYVLSLLIGFIEFLPLGEKVAGHINRKDLQTLLEIEGAEGDLHEHERRMALKVFDLRNTRVYEIMRPLIEVVAADSDATVAQAAALMTARGVSRLPIYNDRIDNIVGVVSIYEVLHKPNDAVLGEIMQPVFFAPESQRVDKLLELIRDKRPGLVVVVDEYGGAVGVATTEDVLEEVTGDILDEYDRLITQVRKLGEDHYEFNARIELEEVVEELEIEFPEGHYETLGGFFLECFDCIPVAGDSIVHEGYEFTVLRASEKAIKTVRCRLRDRAEETAAETRESGESTAT